MRATRIGLMMLGIGVGACGDDAPSSLPDSGAPGEAGKLDAGLKVLDGGLAEAAVGELPAMEPYRFGPGYQQISTGRGRICAIDGDGGLGCWSSGASDFTGDQPPVAGVTFKQVEVSESGAVCALRDDGAFLCWHDDGSLVDTPSGTFSHIAVGTGTGCGVQSDGALACWQERLLTIPAQPPVDVPPGNDFVSVEMDTDYACARARDGRVNCWFILAPPDAFPAGPRQPLRSLSDSCGLSDDGTPVCWGIAERFAAPQKFAALDTSYQLGCGIAFDGRLSCFGLTDAVPRYAPPGDDYESLSVGEPVACALRRNGASACWRTRTVGMERPPADSFKQVSVGAELNDGMPQGVGLACGVRVDGALRCWGGSNYTLPEGHFRSVAAGYGFACALREDGVVLCFGEDWIVATTMYYPPANGHYAQLDVEQFITCVLDEAGSAQCFGNFAPSPAPAQPFAQLRTNGFSACALGTDGEISCWGDSTSSHLSLPSPPVGPFKQLDVGQPDACAIRRDGSLACWSLAQGVRPRAALPGRFTQVSISKTHNTAIREDGTLASWPVPSSRTGDAAWPPAGRYSQVSAGENVDCAVREDGRAICWPYQSPALPTSP